MFGESWLRLVLNLQKALSSNDWGVRYWGTQWAIDFPDERLVSILIKLMNDPHKDCH